MIDRNRELEGKVAIVTGSARNIGRAIAEELARAGAAVTINARSAGDLCDEVTAGIRAGGGRAHACLADISDPADVKRLADETIAEFGGIDILINNAAIRTRAAFPELTFEDWAKLRAVALDGALHMALACTPSMIERGGGSIVGISGLNAYKGAADGAHKSAVKTGMAGMIRGMASDLGKYGITCNVAVVGPFDTDRAGGSGTLAISEPNPNIPMGRRGVPQDMADLVRFLVGPYSRFITGQTIHVNGGALMPS
ncbi:MAG: SDR family oxidoreductase [Pseudomonadota bacterium]